MTEAARAEASPNDRRIFIVPPPDGAAVFEGNIALGPARVKAAADPAEVRAVAEATGIPTLVGSGVTVDNVAEYAAADAYVVGSWLKRGGAWTNPLDSGRLDALIRPVGK